MGQGRVGSDCLCACDLFGGDENVPVLGSGDGCIQRRHWHPTPVLLPGKSHGWRSLVGCGPWGR